MWGNKFFKNHLNLSVKFIKFYAFLNRTFRAFFSRFFCPFSAKKALKFTAILTLLMLFFSVLFIFLNFSPNALQQGFEKRYSKVLFDKDEQILSAFINEEEQWHLKANSIPKRLKIAAIEYEDKRFYSHFGVDFSALFRAFVKNLSKDKRSGASTISMQVIKLYERNERTYLNKFSEIIKALRLERSLKKDEILSLYLNNAPYGGNLVGFSSAILFYFDKKPEDLSWSEAALLAVLPNAPGLMNLEKNKIKLKAKRNALLHKLCEKGHFDKDILRLALAEPLPSFKPRKNLAPHLALRLLSDKQKQAFSSIDKNLQMKFEQKTKEFSINLARQGIKNVAVLLADTKTRKVLAYVGSQDFYDSENLGQVNGIVAKRSVGSTLKPILFALAIDEGLICTESLLLDVPTFFSNFNPQNANKKYYGLIRAQEALQKSLNVPFVSLLQSYGYERFFYEMKDFVGFDDEDFNKYGLSFILGTKEMSLEELVRLYLGLANYGELAEISYLQDENLSTNLAKKANSKRRMFSKGSAYLTLDTMKELKRVGVEQFNQRDKIISWKTGTSYGRKDAWALGATPRYTLGVWAGNFTGEANANLYGVSVAGELFFELLNLLDGVSEEFVASDDLMALKIDSATGYRYDLPVKFSFAPYPKDAKALRVSPYLKKVFEFEGVEVDSRHLNFKNATPKIKLDLPLHALAFLKESGVKFEKSKSVKILYPTKNLHIVATRDLHAKNALIVRVANLKDENLFWYLNNSLVYEGKDKSKEFDLKAGKYELFIISQSGQSDEISFWVE